MSVRYTALRGTRDILPAEAATWQFVESTARRVFGRHGFREIRTPVLEATELFARSVGTTSEIVTKQMYTFNSGEESVCLRPEGTAPVVRAFVEHSLHREVAEGYPERYYYLGPMFRHERPQRGRQRQFHQVGVEVLGAREPLADAEAIAMAIRLLDELSVKGYDLRINSVGNAACRPRYVAALSDWLGSRSERLCEDCRRRAVDNPLRVFDCKVEADRRLLAEAPTLLDGLCEECDAHFRSVTRLLTDVGVPFEIDPRLVRGLDYYERTVFEVVHGGLGAQNALLGGGRFDGLVAELGGPAIPGFGFAAGLERLILALPEGLAGTHPVDLLLVPLGPEALGAAFALASRLRQAGVSVILPLAERPLGAQMRRADRLGARFALFIGEKELAESRFGLKDLTTGQQTRVDEAGVLARVRDGDDDGNDRPSGT